MYTSKGFIFNHFYLFGHVGVEFFSQELQLLLSDECIALRKGMTQKYL